MSAETAHKARERALATVVESAWAQWAALTSAALPAGPERAWTIVDPEGLVLASFTASERERRLSDLAASWAHDAAELMSLHRLRALSADFPESVRHRLAIFARAAVAGGDKRWKRWPDGVEASAYDPRLKEIGPVRLRSGPALTLRLRAGFGVNAKADILSLLLGLHGAAADLKVVAAATGYTDRAIRNATEDMVLGGFIREIEGRPSSYSADPHAWAHVLQTDRFDGAADHTIPPWRFWGAVYSFLADVIAWADEAERSEWTGYVTTSRARDVVERHRRRLRQAGIETASGPGPAFLEHFEDLLGRVHRWALTSLYARP